MKKIRFISTILILCILFIISHINLSGAYATATSIAPDYLKTQTEVDIKYPLPCDNPTLCTTKPTECWNNEAIEVTSCGPGCTNGDLWSKYNYIPNADTGNCRLKNSNECVAAYVYSDKAYSTADKCINPGSDTTLAPGLCDGSWGGPYKYCCTSTGNPEACIQGGIQDTSYPPEGVCPGGYIIDGSRVRSSACTPIITPTPTPTPPPTSSYGCSGPNQSCVADPTGTHKTSNCDGVCPTPLPIGSSCAYPSVWTCLSGCTAMSTITGWNCINTTTATFCSGGFCKNQSCVPGSKTVICSGANVCIR